MQSSYDLREELILRATEDADFRQQLLADPYTAIKDVLGVSVPDDVLVQVHEDANNLVNLVLPPMEKLDIAQLEAAIGGQATAATW